MAADGVPHRADDIGDRVEPRQHSRPGRPCAERVERARQEEQRHYAHLRQRRERLNPRYPGRHHYAERGQREGQQQFPITSRSRIGLQGTRARACQAQNGDSPEGGNRRVAQAFPDNGRGPAHTLPRAPQGHFVIVGHPRQMEPRMAHDHIRATLADPEGGFTRVRRIFIVVDVPLRQVGDLDDGLGHSVSSRASPGASPGASSGASPGASSGVSSAALPDGRSVLPSARIR